jgi:uncharacterized membrane protein YeaQ/YmgE (transglycosylase-associated protein family)
MDIGTLVIQIISGAVGGNVAGAVLKKFSLGTLGNSLVGILGGGLGGQLLSALGFGVTGAGSGSLDVGSIVASIASGGVGGGVLLTLIGLVKQAMGKGKTA